MDPQIMSIFLQYHAKAKGNFVIPSGKPPKTVSRGDYNRCESHFDALNAWLRSRGEYPETTAHAPEGVWFTNQLHAASKALRHADINVTNNFTSPGSTGSRRRRVSVPNGHFTHGLYGNRMGPTYGGETVAVFGCGPVGLMAQKVAQVKGARKVVGIDREAYRLAIPDRVAEAETSTLKKRTRLSGSEK